ncbi:MAG TPA: biotin/lipoyl-containing protein [Amycolatopsis sp.]|nr:biotin/lipoyl-containing protein [Amycolatopsis sp.]
MAFELSIPQLGVTMTEGTLSQWLVEDGGTVHAGDPIYLLETDKTETEIEAPVDGVLRIKAEPGDYAVGTVVGELS